MNAILRRLHIVAKEMPGGVLFHGTRALKSVMASGVLIPSPCGDKWVSFSRSAEEAVYWGILPWTDMDPSDAGVLVFDRQMLQSHYRIEPMNSQMSSTLRECEECIFERVNILRSIVDVVKLPMIGKERRDLLKIVKKMTNRWQPQFKNAA